MIITRETLDQHNACESQVTKFVEAFPDGCPVPESSEDQIKLILEHEVIRQNWGWAVGYRLIPAWSMREADLRRTDLGGADLRWANLGGADLRWANLSWADLRGANLGGAYLRGTNLGGANLRWVYLRGANLVGANLPDGFDAERAGAIT